MRLRAIIIGIVSGLLLGGVIGLLRGPRSLFPAVPLGEDGGKIVRVEMQYHPGAGALVAPIYSQFLAGAGKDVQVVWVVAQSADLGDLQPRLGTAWPAGRCRAVVAGKEISTWAKDRFVTMFTPGHAGDAVLCAPARRLTINPLHTNDQEVPYLLAQQANTLFHVRETDVDFDGGDFLATARHLFANPAIIEKNQPGAGARFHSTADLTDYLNRKLSAHITWLGFSPAQSPPHHIGMYLTVMGHIAAVGDVRLAQRQSGPPGEILSALRQAGGPATPAFLTDLSARLDGVARQLQALGYTVVRVPLLPSATPKAWMSYNNGIVETRGGATIFYMPTFGAPTLDAAAAATFHQATGCTVIPIDCAKIWQLGGSLHCLVSVVERKPSGGI